MIRAHAEAVVALIEAEGVTVHDGLVPSTPSLPYVVVYANNGAVPDTGAGDNFDGTSTFREFTVQTTAVGRDRTQAQWAAEKVAAALLDVTPTVPGRDTGMVRLVDSRPVIKDDDVDPAVMYGVDLWRFSSVPS